MQNREEGGGGREGEKEGVNTDKEEDRVFKGKEDEEITNSDRENREEEQRKRPNTIRFNKDDLRKMMRMSTNRDDEDEYKS